MTAMTARQPTNFIPSCENLKSTGFGKSMERTSSPLDVEKPRQSDKNIKKSEYHEYHQKTISNKCIT